MENNITNEQSGLSTKAYELFSDYKDKLQNIPTETIEAILYSLSAQQNYWNGFLMHYNEFMSPYWTALNSFLNREKTKIKEVNLLQTSLDYFELFKFNLQIFEKATKPSIQSLHKIHVEQSEKFVTAYINSLFDLEGEDIRDFSERHSVAAKNLLHVFPEAIRDVRKEYGFHFDDGGYDKIAETDRFMLYQVFSRDKSVKVNKKLKPILILPPYVLGPNILGFLPDDKKSYAHAYADQGIPTYIRIMKEVHATPALQIMTGEDDARDTRCFCEIIKKKHSRKVTLNGFCQGGFVGLMNILSGELDGLVDAFITCVSPMDGTRSRSLVEYLEHVPERFRDLSYAEKIMPSGHLTVDGRVMSWVYKLKSMEREAPVVTFNQSLASFIEAASDFKVNKTAAALNHWLLYDRNDLPIAITQMSFDSYTIPVKEDGTLPVKLFGKELNFKAINEKKIKWLLCYAQSDDLVDKDAALAPLQFVKDIEVTVFPKGHGAMATSWSHPDTECALHKRFNGYRGPVRFQLDISKE